MAYIYKSGKVYAGGGGGGDGMFNDMDAQELETFLNGIEAEGPNLADYVVEQGTETVSGIDWKYRKWNNGTSECWGRLQVGANTPQGSVGGFYWSLFGAYGLPTNLFVEVPQGFFNLHYWDTGVFWGNVRTITATTVQAVVFRNNNASATAEGSFYLIGKWK